MFHGIYTIASEQGPAGLYKGALATILKQSTNQGVRFVVFDETKKRLSNYCSMKTPVEMVSGAFAGFCSSMLNNPIDVVKTKMQGKDAAKYAGFVDCFKQIYATHGWLGFYAGIGPRLIRVMLDVSLTFTLFHSLKRNVTAFVTGVKGDGH